jgi:hypothetical protein
MTSTQQITILSALAVVSIVSAPLIRIWALNTFFGFDFAYTFMNWLSIGLLLK